MKSFLSDDDFFKDMMDCVLNAGLPVFKDPCVCDGNPNKFKSIFKIDHVDVHVDGSYDASNRFARTRFTFDDPIDSKNMDTARQIINSLNATRPFYHYSLCPCCNSIEVRFGINASAAATFKRKFEVVFCSLLTEIKEIYPLMIKTIKGCGDFNSLTEEMKKKHAGSMPENNSSSGKAVNNKKLDKLLKTMDGVLAKWGWPSCRTNIKNNRFAIDVELPGIGDFTARLGFYISNSGYIVISMAYQGKIPGEKTAFVMDVINRLNNIFIAEHLWLDSRTNHVVVMKGIVLPKMRLDSEEFEDGLNKLAVHGTLMLKTVHEQTVSNQKPEELVNRMISMHIDHSNDCEEISKTTLSQERRENNENCTQ